MYKLTNTFAFNQIQTQFNLIWQKPTKITNTPGKRGTHPSRKNKMRSTTSTQRSLTHRTESTESKWRLTHTATTVVDSYRRRSRSRRLSHSDCWLETEFSLTLSFTSDDHPQNHDSVTQTKRHTDEEDDDTNSSQDSGRWTGKPEKGFSHRVSEIQRTRATCAHTSYPTKR